MGGDLARNGRVIISLWLVVVAHGVANGERDDIVVRRMLRMLHGVEHEYREAFDENGALVRPLELEEASLLLAEIERSVAAVALHGADIESQVAALAADMRSRAPATRIASQCRALREAIVAETGTAEEVSAPAPPSATRGAALYAVNCASCHGANGAGDGPDADKLERRPPDFTDAAFMETETPADFFLVISLGRQTSGMPAWENELSVQERWDLVSYLWFLGTTAADQDKRFVLALQRVGQRVAEAVSAYRLQEAGASAVAMDAYMSFEPLEARVSASAPGLVGRVEAEFVRLQRALQQPDSLKEVEAAGQAVAESLLAVRAHAGARQTGAHWAIAACVIASVCAGLWLIVRRR